MVTAQRPATEIEDADIPVLMAEIGRNAKAAARSLANASTEAKNAALRSAARRIRENAESIENANVSDLAVGGQKGLTDAMLDRLRLTGDRIEAMAGGLEDIAALPDPVGAVLAVFERPNGLRIERVRVPLGVIGVIYESRPNVTADAGALALKAGNACILRGGSESFHSSRAIFTCLRDGAAEAGIAPGLRFHGADARPGRGGRDARHVGRDRRHRPARRSQPNRKSDRGKQDSLVQASGGRLSYLYSRGGGFEKSPGRRGQREDASNRHLRSDRNHFGRCRHRRADRIRLVGRPW